MGHVRGNELVSASWGAERRTRSHLFPTRICGGRAHTDVLQEIKVISDQGTARLSGKIFPVQ